MAAAEKSASSAGISAGYRRPKEAGGGVAADDCRGRRAGEGWVRVPWTEEEHKRFLLGLQKLGKGDWRGISRKFVITRTPTQVASHAQKYFVRQDNRNRRKRRSSLFDMVPEFGNAQTFPVGIQETKGQSSNPISTPSPLGVEHEPINPNSIDLVPSPQPPKPETTQFPCTVMWPYPYFPFSYPFWPCYQADATVDKVHSIVKPTAVHYKAPINVNDIVGISNLSLGEEVGRMSSSSMPINPLGGSDRHSAFRTNNPEANSSEINSSSSPAPIHAT
ncbi:uncharacterized protein A4U43_C08F3340 [Asparagus officinalis]|nr:uncharacterized protein A4U43_C08F3340 [Asparagus officinalis]